MTKSELIEKGKQKVRNTPDLLHIYISLFAQEFGYSPNCAGCTFESDWRKFVGGNKNPKAIIMSSEKTFEFKKKYTNILGYRKDGKTHRVYANKATEEFIEQYLTNGTEEELADRKSMFKKLPVLLRESKVEDKPKVKATRKKKG